VFLSATRSRIAALLFCFVLACRCAPAAAGPGSQWLHCDHGWESYATAEALLLQRDNETNATPLVINGDTLQSAITTNDLKFPAAPGVRIGYGQHGPEGIGWELGYAGVYGMFADATASGNGNLDIAGDLVNAVTSLRSASIARAAYTSVLNMAEANLLLTEVAVHRPRQSAYVMESYPCHAWLDWIAGFRWAGLDEQSSILLAAEGVESVGRYGVRTSSNLFGGQLGVRGRMQWRRWGFEGGVKAAVASANVSQSQDPIVDTVINQGYRPGWSAQDSTVGGIFDMNLSLLYRFNDAWRLRLGYNSIWLTGVALAPSQFDFAADPTPGTGIVGCQTLWLNGMNLGLETRW
jgi:hypothetical protein